MELKVITNSVPLTHFIKQDVPDGVEISIQPFEEKRGVDSEILIQIIVGLSTNIMINLVSDWLYDKLSKHPSTKLEYSRREIEMKKGEITKIIEENIKIDR